MAWVKANLIKQKCFWTMKVPGDCSWCWRKILQLRAIVRPFIRHQIGTGKEVFFWHDFWQRSGPLSTVTAGVRCFPSMFDLATVAEVYRDGEWRWPRCCDPRASSIRVAVENEVFYSAQDPVLWTANASQKFCTTDVAKALRPPGPKVPWLPGCLVSPQHS